MYLSNSSIFLHHSTFSKWQSLSAVAESGSCMFEQLGAIDTCMFLPRLAWEPPPADSLQKPHLLKLILTTKLNLQSFKRESIFLNNSCEPNANMFPQKVTKAKKYTLFGIDESFLATNCSSLEPRWGINRIDVYSEHTRTVWCKSAFSNSWERAPAS